MRRIIPLALALCLLLCRLGMPGFAQASQALSRAELLAWRDNIWTLSQDTSPLYDPQADSIETAQWVTYPYAFGTVTLAEATDGPQAVTQIEITASDIACPRGLSVGASLELVLAAYPNENASLSGSMLLAQLYESQHDGEEGWGWLSRRGEIVDSVTYSAATPVQDGVYEVLSIVYSLEEGLVTGYRVSGFDEAIPEQSLRDTFRRMHEIATADAFTPQQMPQDLRLSMQDLTFAGISFDSATPDNILDAFGDPLDSIREASSGVWTIVYAESLFEFVQVGDTWQLSAARIANPAIAGPRGLRVEDTLSSVFDRFGEGDTEDALMYQCQDGQGNGFALTCSFSQDLLTEYLLYRI